MESSNSGEVAVIKIEDETEKIERRVEKEETCLCIPRRKSSATPKSQGGVTWEYRKRRSRKSSGMCACDRIGRLFSDCWSDLRSRKFSLAPPQEFHIDNSHPAHYKWLTMVTIAALYNVVFIVGRAFFWELDEKWPKLWTILDALSDFIYLTDMLVHAHEGYLEEGLMVKDPRKLRRNYFRSPHFKLDLVSILPTELVVLGFASASPASSEPTPWPPPVPRPVIARLNRLARLPRANTFFSKTETRTPHPNAFRIAKVLGTTLLLIHWNACAYFALSCFLGFGSDGWVYGGVPAHQKAAMNMQASSLTTATAGYLQTGRSNTAAPHDGSNGSGQTEMTTPQAQVPMSRSQAVRLTTTLSHQYIYSFYWSTLTLTTIGETPPPETELEHVFVALDFLAGVLIFATIVGNVGTMVSGAGAARLAFRAKCDAVKRYLTLRKVSKDLEDRVIRWFDYVWASRQALMDEEEGRVLSALPPHLRSEIALHVHLETLRQVRIFQDAEPGLLAELVLKLRLQVFSPGDYVCRKGDVGRELYIVKKGRLHVVASPGTKKKKKRHRTEAEKMARRQRHEQERKKERREKIICERGGYNNRRRWWWWWYGCCPGGCCSRTKSKSSEEGLMGRCCPLRGHESWRLCRNKTEEGLGCEGSDRKGFLAGLKNAFKLRGAGDSVRECQTISGSDRRGDVIKLTRVNASEGIEDKVTTASEESSESEEEEEVVQATLGAGSVFGEVALLEIPGTKTGNRRTASVRSVGYSDLFCLSKADLWAALEEYPAARRRLSERSRRILAKDGLLTDKKSENEENKEGAANKNEGESSSAVQKSEENKECDDRPKEPDGETLQVDVKEEGSGQMVTKHVKIGRVKVSPIIEEESNVNGEAQSASGSENVHTKVTCSNSGENDSKENAKAVENQSDVEEIAKDKTVSVDGSSRPKVRTLSSPEEKDSADGVGGLASRQSTFQSDDDIDDDEGQSCQKDKNLETRIQHIEELLENLQLRFARLMAEFCSNQAKVKQRLAVIEQNFPNARSSSTRSISKLDKEVKLDNSMFSLSPSVILTESNTPRQNRQSSV